MVHPDHLDQPTLDFELPPAEEVALADPARRAQTAVHIAEVGQRHDYVQRTSEAYADLGGGTATSLAAEAPIAQPTDRPRRPTGNVRDVEPRDSDLDPHWNTPSTELSDTEKAAKERGVAEARKALQRAQAPALYDHLQQYPLHQQAAILRARSERRGR